MTRTRARSLPGQVTSAALDGDLLDGGRSGTQPRGYNVESSGRTSLYYSYDESTPETERAVWLPVGHTHSESPAGVNGLSRLPSPGFGNWVGSPVLFLETGLGHQSWRQSTADHYTARLSPGRSTAYNCGCDLTSSNLELYQLKDRRLQHPRFVPIQHRVLPIVN